MKEVKTYSELITIPSFEERLKYLMWNGFVGEETFGSKRYLNQIFYNSDEWRSVRNQAIIRDCGCDLGVEGMEIFGTIIVHHITPITIDDVLTRSSRLLSLDNLICTSDATHKAIHYSNTSAAIVPFKERCANDTCPWKGLRQ